MKQLWLAPLALTVSLAMAATPPRTALDQSSDQASGLVVVTSDLAVSGGRMLVKIVAYNKGDAPAALGPEQVHLRNARGEAVSLATLGQLEDDIRIAFGAKPLLRPGDWSSTAAMKRPTVSSASGVKDGRGLSGGDTVITAETASRGRRFDESANARMQAELDRLRAAILQPLSIAPQSAGGGNIVAQELKLARKDSRALSLSVEFAGERHEFKFDVPRQ